MRDPSKCFNKFKGELRNVHIKQEYLNKCENENRTGFFHNGWNRSIEAPSERTEFT